MTSCSKCGSTSLTPVTPTLLKKEATCDACGQRNCWPHSIKDTDDMGEYYGVTINERIEERSDAL